jgi:hypothetical protein
MDLNILNKINQLADEHCEDCPVQKVIRTSHGDRNANKYCLNICKVGKEMARLGKGIEYGQPDIRKAQELTKETYMALSRQGTTDRDICKIYNIGTTTLGRRKRKWGVKKPIEKPGIDDYNHLRRMGYYDKDICQAWKIGSTTLLRYKKKWGIK